MPLKRLKPLKNEHHHQTLIPNNNNNNNDNGVHSTVEIELGQQLHK